MSWEFILFEVDTWQFVVGYSLDYTLWFHLAWGLLVWPVWLIYLVMFKLNRIDVAFFTVAVAAFAYEVSDGLNWVGYECGIFGLGDFPAVLIGCYMMTKVIKLVV